MLTPADLHGTMAMMPAFATDDAADIQARSTIHTEHLREGVDRIIRDGVDVIATTGSFGEFHTLLRDEFETLTVATVEAVNHRVPLFIGCTSLNSREAVEKIAFARDAGADGVLVGVPFYFPSTIENALRFYREIAELFPTLAIMIYHNPPLHRVTLGVEAFRRIVQSPNIMAMKDSHRDTRAFMRLHEIVGGRISMFVNQGQYFPFGRLGAPGFWSYDCWMGPWPLVRLREAVVAGDDETARAITMDLLAMTISGTATAPSSLEWRETASKIAAQHAGYCQPGPLRPPFLEIPSNVRENAQKYAAHWQRLCARYRPPVEAPALAGV